MRWNLHGVIIEGISHNATLRQSWQASFASLPTSQAPPDLICRLELSPTMPSPPAGRPQFTQRDLLHYYVQDEQIIVHFPRFGQLLLDLAQGTANGQIIATSLDTYGVLEDLIAISLSPHLRRRSLYLIHAFGAAFENRAVLLVGDIGAGKTTTGISLLNAGWQILSNDSPIVTQRDGVPFICQYPGLLSGYPETFARFPATQAYLQDRPPASRHKLTIAAEAVWPGVWQDQAAIGAILFPQIENRPDHQLEPLAAPAALARLMPHAMEQWDRPMMPGHLRLLRQLVEAAPTFVLRLGPEVISIPQALHAGLDLIKR
jgi:hypothetical protein